MGEYLTPVPSLPGLLSQEQAFPEQADSVALFPLLCIPEAWIIINSLGTTFLHLLHLALQCPLEVRMNIRIFSPNLGEEGELSD